MPRDQLAATRDALARRSEAPSSRQSSETDSAELERLREENEELIEEILAMKQDEAEEDVVNVRLKQELAAARRETTALRAQAADASRARAHEEEMRALEQEPLQEMQVQLQRGAASY